MDYIYYKLDDGQFDWERNYYFMKRIMEGKYDNNQYWFPMCQLMVSEHIEKQMEQKFNDPGFTGRLSGDSNPEYNHDTHCHIGMGKSTNHN